MKPLLLLLPAALLSAAMQAPPSASWYRLTLDDGTAIGHASVEARRTAEGRETVATQEVRLQEAGDPLTRQTSETVTREDASGRVTSISDLSRTGRNWTRTIARIEPGRAVVTRSTASGSHTTDIRLPQGVRFDGGSGLLRGWDPAAMPRLEFAGFSLDAASVDRITIEPAPGATPDAEGKLTLLRKRYEGANLRGIAMLTLDRNRRIVAVTQPMFGTAVTSRPVTQAEALAPYPPFRFFAATRIKSPYRIADASTQKRIRYRFGFRDGIAFALPETGDQHVTADGDGISVDICTQCGMGLPSDPAYLADARRATPWLQSEAPRIRAMVAAIARSNLSGTRKMERFVELAQQSLPRVDFAGHYSALDALARRAGDCGEMAVLVATFGRAAGIPTRVVNGLVYSRERYHGISNAFMPHAWVLAWVDGRWQSFDAALGAFDSTHIAITIGDGDLRAGNASNQLAGLLAWRTMAEVRTSPAPAP